MFDFVDVKNRLKLGHNIESVQKGSLLFLKAVPLVFAFRGVSKGSLYTMQWASMLVLLYLMEGVVRVASDPPGPSILMAWVIFVSMSIFSQLLF